MQHPTGRVCVLRRRDFSFPTATRRAIASLVTALFFLSFFWLFFLSVFLSRAQTNVFSFSLSLSLSLAIPPLQVFPPINFGDMDVEQQANTLFHKVRARPSHTHRWLARSLACTFPGSRVTSITRLPEKKKCYFFFLMTRRVPDTRTHVIFFPSIFFFPRPPPPQTGTAEDALRAHP